MSRVTGTSFAAERAAGREEILALVRKLDDPIMPQPLTWHGEGIMCEWCHVEWFMEKRHDWDMCDYLRHAVHPQNGCLFVLAFPSGKK